MIVGTDNGIYVMINELFNFFLCYFIHYLICQQITPPNRMELRLHAILIIYFFSSATQQPLSSQFAYII